jgi:hypothetical protein
MDDILSVLIQYTCVSLIFTEYNLFDRPRAWPTRFRGPLPPLQLNHEIPASNLRWVSILVFRSVVLFLSISRIVAAVKVEHYAVYFRKVLVWVLPK